MRDYFYYYYHYFILSIFSLSLFLREKKKFQPYSNRKFNNKIHFPISGFHWTDWQCMSVSMHNVRTSIEPDRCGFCSNSIEIKTNVSRPPSPSSPGYCYLSPFFFFFFTWFWSVYKGDVLARTMNFDREIFNSSLSIFEFDWLMPPSTTTNLFRSAFFFFFENKSIEKNRTFPIPLPLTIYPF